MKLTGLSLALALCLGTSLAHAATGAQSTVSGTVDFAAIAHATGYAEAWRARSLDDIDAFLARPRAHGAALLHMKIRTGTIDNLPRPTVQPPEVVQRLQRQLGGGA